MENGYIESFNGRLRDECLNMHQFFSLEDARDKIKAWRVDYNQHRPHSALGHLTPSEYAMKGRDERANKDYEFLVSNCLRKGPRTVIQRLVLV